MIDSLSHIQTEHYDPYTQRRFTHGRRKKRLVRRGRPPIGNRNLGFPVKVKFPTKKQPKIVKGNLNKAIKLPPTNPVIKNTGVVKPRTSTLAVKQSSPKKLSTKIDIGKLIDKTNKTSLEKKQLAKAQEKEVISDDAKEKTAMQSDRKVYKIVKVIAGVGLMGVTGYIIYRLVKHQKLKKQLKK